MYKLNKGDKFGSWTVVDGKSTVSKWSHQTYLCKCVCGTCLQVKAILLVSGKAVRCRKCSSNERYKGVGDLSGGYFSQIKLNAFYRNLEISIDIEYIYDIFIKQQKKCALSNLDITLDRYYSIAKKGSIRQTASLDRIDSTKGYVEGNVQWVHKDVNNMKMGLGQEYFIELCKKITKHNDNTQNESNK